MPKLKKLKRQSNDSPTVIFIRVTEDLGSRLKRLADDDRRELAPYCRLILEEHVEKARKTA